MNKTLLIRIAARIGVAASITAAQLAYCMFPLWPYSAIAVIGGLYATFGCLCFVSYNPPRKRPALNYAHLQEGILT